MSEILLEQVKQHRRGIKHETLTFSLAELVNMYETTPREIVIQPDFQRLFRWSRKQQSDFIESLILEIPIPPLFFYENPDGTWDLLDGLQRFSTVLRFFNVTEIPSEHQGVSGNENEWHYEKQNDLAVPLQLLDGDYLNELRGFSFGTLPTQLQINLKRARLHIYVLKRETDAMYKYEVFKRLNRGGTQAEDQEIRNCSVRLLGKEFPEFLKEIAADKNYREALARSEEDERNGYVEELALRFFALKNGAGNFKHDVSDFMTAYMEDVAKTTLKFDYLQEKAVFLETWKAIKDALSDGEAFRGRTENDRPAGPFSPLLFEIISIGIATNIQYVKTLTPDELKQKITELLHEVPSRNVTGSGSNSRKKTIGRLNLGKGWFKAPQ
jgi:hypothetical protein